MLWENNPVLTNNMIKTIGNYFTHGWIQYHCFVWSHSARYR